MKDNSLQLIFRLSITLISKALDLIITVSFPLHIFNFINNKNTTFDQWLLVTKVLHLK